MFVKHRGRGTYEDRHVGDLASDQRRVRQGGNPQGHVDPFVDQIDEPVFEPQIERHVRIGDKEGVKRRTERQLAEIARRRHTQQPARFRRLMGDRGIEIVEMGKDLADLAIVGLTRLGKAQRPRRTVHQPDAKFVLEIGDIFGQQRLGAAMSPRRRGKTTGLEHLNKSAQPRQILWHA